jgi:penicillin-binding protein 2
LGDRLSRADEARTARVAYVVTALVFLVLSLRLFHVQVVEHRKYERLARENQFRIKRVIAPRGVIRDRTGKSLVDNVAEYQLFVDPAALRDDALMQALARDFGVDVAAARAAQAAQRARNQGHMPAKVLGNVTKAQVARFEENAAHYPGAFLEARGRRRYIFNDLATHVLGYVGEVGGEQVEQSSGPRAYRLGDVAGKAGVEALLENELRGLDGKRWVQVNAAGQELFELADKAVPPVPGNSVYLTIDYALQNAIENELWPQERAGAVVVMDVSTGELLAAVSKPGYDLNRFAVGISNADYNVLRNDPLTPLYNRYAVGTYPPGSTWKIVSTTALTDHGVTTISRVAPHPCWGSYQVGRRPFKCHKEEGHGHVAMMGGFEQSCDVYFYQHAHELGIDGLASTARRLGFGQKTGFALPESRGLVPDTPYYDRTLGERGWTWAVAVNCIIGQGEVLVTPLQMARLVAAVANGGKLLEPHIVRRIVDASGRAVEMVEPRVMQDNVFSPAMLDFLHTAMLRVVIGERGTAKSALPESLLVAGKTGTAETPGKKEDHAWFVFYAPHDHPQIAGVVLVERAGHGGAVAAPLARQIISKWFGIEDKGHAYWRRLPELRKLGLVGGETS